MKRLKWLIPIMPVFFPLAVLLPSNARAVPLSVAVAGSFQSELGCSGDWDAACSDTELLDPEGDGVWKNIFAVPAGNYEYKAALNDTWDENYGLNASLGGPNIPLNLGANENVSFYYSEATHWITDNVNTRIVTAPGSYQSELGCSGDWDPSCLRSWLQDPDGDGLFSFSALIPAGNYEVKAAINEGWDENYGIGGAPGGANIVFSVPSGSVGTLFTFDSSRNLLTISEIPRDTTTVPEPSTMLLLGSGLLGLAGLGRKRMKK